MPPSASATPPTHTTQRVPKRSSKPIGFGGDGKAGDTGGGGTEVGCGGGRRWRFCRRGGFRWRRRGLWRQEVSRRQATLQHHYPKVETLQQVAELDRHDQCNNGDDREGQRRQHDQHDPVEHRSPREIAVASL